MVARSPRVMAKHGYLDLLKTYYDNNYILENDQYYIKNKHFINDNSIIAMENNQFETLQFLLKDDGKLFNSKWEYINYDSLFILAFKSGNQKMIDYVYSLRFHINPLHWSPPKVLSEIAAIGQLAVCQWFAERFSEKIQNMWSQHKWDYLNLMYGAATKGSVEIIKWATDYFKSDSDYVHERVWRTAVTNNHQDLLYYLIDDPEYNVSFKDIDLMVNAIRNSTLEVIQWLFNNNAKYELKSILEAAIDRADIDIITFLYQKLNKTNNSMVAEWLCKSCSDFGINVIDRAISNRNLTLIKWLNENGSFTGTTHALNNAALKADYVILEWFTVNKRIESISDNVLNEMASFGTNYPIMKWIFKNRKELPTNVKVLDYLFTVCLVYHNQDDILALAEWFIKNRKDCKQFCTTKSMDHAILKNNFQLLEWLHMNKATTTVGYSSSGFEKALTHHHTPEMITWLHKNRTEKYYISEQHQTN